MNESFEIGVPVPLEEHHTVIGSKGDRYEVVNPKQDNVEWTCTCPHYFHRKTECKHIREVKTKLGII